eukprot:1010382-Pleurochrysis_carterae.AAC.1
MRSPKRLTCCLLLYRPSSLLSLSPCFLLHLHPSPLARQGAAALTPQRLPPRARHSAHWARQQAVEVGREKIADAESGRNLGERQFEAVRQADGVAQRCKLTSVPQRQSAKITSLANSITEAWRQSLAVQIREGLEVEHDLRHHAAVPPLADLDGQGRQRSHHHFHAAIAGQLCRQHCFAAAVERQTCVGSKHSTLIDNSPCLITTSCACACTATCVRVMHDGGNTSETHPCRSLTDEDCKSAPAAPRTPCSKNR